MAIETTNSLEVTSSIDAELQFLQENPSKTAAEATDGAKEVLLKFDGKEESIFEFDGKEESISEFDKRTLETMLSDDMKVEDLVIFFNDPMRKMDFMKELGGLIFREDTAGISGVEDPYQDLYKKIINKLPISERKQLDDITKYDLINIYLENRILDIYSTLTKYDNLDSRYSGDELMSEKAEYEKLYDEFKEELEDEKFQNYIGKSMLLVATIDSRRNVVDTGIKAFLGKPLSLRYNIIRKRFFAKEENMKEPNDLEVSAKVNLLTDFSEKVNNFESKKTDREFEIVKNHIDELSWIVENVKYLTSIDMSGVDGKGEKKDINKRIDLKKMIQKYDKYLEDGSGRTYLKKVLEKFYMILRNGGFNFKEEENTDLAKDYQTHIESLWNDIDKYEQFYRKLSKNSLQAKYKDENENIYDDNMVNAQSEFDMDDNYTDGAPDWRTNYNIAEEGNLEYLKYMRSFNDKGSKGRGKEYYDVSGFLARNYKGPLDLSSVKVIDPKAMKNFVIESNKIGGHRDGLVLDLDKVKNNMEDQVFLDILGTLAKYKGKLTINGNLTYKELDALCSEHEGPLHIKMEALSSGIFTYLLKNEGPIYIESKGIYYGTPEDIANSFDSSDHTDGIYLSGSSTSSLYQNIAGKYKGKLVIYSNDLGSNVLDSFSSSEHNQGLVFPNFIETTKSGISSAIDENPNSNNAEQNFKSAYSFAKELFMPSSKDKDGNYMNSTGNQEREIGIGFKKLNIRDIFEEEIKELNTDKNIEDVEKEPLVKLIGSNHLIEKIYLDNMSVLGDGSDESAVDHAKYLSSMKALNELSMKNYSPSNDVLKELTDINTLYLGYNNETFDAEKAKTLSDVTNLYLDDLENLGDDDSIAKLLFKGRPKGLISLGITELTGDQAKQIERSNGWIMLPNLKDINENSKAFEYLADFDLRTDKLRVHPDLQIKIDKTNNKIK